MADDREVLREIWEGKLPVAFTLSPDEAENERPDTVFVSSGVVCVCVFLVCFFLGGGGGGGLAGWGVVPQRLLLENLLILIHKCNFQKM